jgi:hypothetical protein
MKRALTIIGVAVASFILGATFVLFVKRAPDSTIPKDWITIIPDRNPTLFDISAMKSDIPPPQPGKLEGRVKFLENDKGIQIGYVLTRICTVLVQFPTANGFAEHRLLTEVIVEPSALCR